MANRQSFLLCALACLLGGTCVFVVRANRPQQIPGQTSAAPATSADTGEESMPPQASVAPPWTPPRAPALAPPSDSPPPTDAGSPIRGPGTAVRRADRQRDLENLEKVTDWDEFYRLSRTLAVGGRTLQSLVLSRVARQLELSAEHKATLGNLVQAEQEEVTKTAVGIYGSGQALHGHALGGPASKGFWAHLRQIRDEVRRAHDAKYNEHFDASRIRVINEHLRNRTLAVGSQTVSGRVEYVVDGVGK